MGKVDAITCRLTELPCQPHRELLTTHHTARGEGRKADPLKTISNISVLFILRGFTTNMPLTPTGGDGTLLSECEQVVDRRERDDPTALLLLQQLLLLLLLVVYYCY